MFAIPGDIDHRVHVRGICTSVLVLHDTKGWSPSERFYERHFVENTTRNPDGRYVVRLPKREELLWQLDSNHYNATRRFYALERSLSRDTEKKAMYFRFIQQYVSLGHMRAVTAEELDVKPQYVLPHHAVMKPESTTTKLRTVFDASCRSRTGLSLNDILIAEPTIQDDIVCLILRFRMYRFVVSADIEKMFWQILVHPSDQPLLRILWRGDKDSPLTTFQLLTVTYGTNSAPFLAARTLQKLADDEESRFPLAAQVVRNDFYVDNLLTGADNISDLIVVCDQLIQIMSAGGMSLRQWSSNSQEILDTIPVDLRETETILELDRESFVTALGLRWEPSTDLLSFKQPKWVGCERLTKRIILSFISSLFDPLGLIGPFIVKLKILLQMLWKLQLDWDIEVPAGFARAWSELQQSIHLLSQLKIPRQVVETNAQLEIHGFCDASLDAYGACLYLRSVSTGGSVAVHLVTAKSKVAPLGSQSIPRLELCAALLLAHLLTKFSNSVDINCKVYLWSDSTIVLNWLAATPSTWEVYVANRVAEIQELTAHACWHHVASGDNPAGTTHYISRGTTLDVLLDNLLWWHGAPWLSKAEEEWPQSSFASIPAFEMERRKVVALPVVVEDADVIDRYSSLSRLLRVSSWCHRFVENIRRKTQGQQAQSGLLMPEEIDCTLMRLVQRVQQQHFASEYRRLANNQQVDRRSRLRFLHPRLVDGLIRLGGRLHNAHIAVDVKHPIVLPPKHRLTILIARQAHLNTHHGGPELLLSTLRRRFWPLGGRNLVRKVYHDCFTCTRMRPSPLQQLMGDLPAVRVHQTYPSQNVGIDYAGLFTFEQRIPDEPYWAVHLELVNSLTTEAFIACLRRFIGRRGKPSNVYCDNAQTFVGAHRELEELRRRFVSQQHREAVSNTFAEDGIHFHFIPPRSPNFGGIWEACVKSTKNLLRKIMGNAHFTESEFITALIQVEAQLNSRPITPLPNSPDDQLALTPGHFLAGRPLNATPEPDLSEVPENRLSRWRRVQKVTRNFWNRWHNEYLQTLQKRYRWTEELDNVMVGSIVALKDEKLPPQKWSLGRILAIRPGHDGLVRVATVRTSSGTSDRAVSKLCLLPTEIDPVRIRLRPLDPAFNNRSASSMGADQRE
ncbi:uncharacterized protein LOC134202151 [Armigeres subalbatus]|uniref:uncharacterized protein LOC134202151 n=1 Tax=Armigeres subalbatus TaxID=124917 RepID=UPI002ECFAEE7